jgi:hypothetical protein
MISEADIRDWLDKCDMREKELEDMELSRSPYPAYMFIQEVRDYFQSQQKQVAALFKKPLI